MRSPVLLPLATLLLLSGCTLNTDYFSEYRGKNLIENYDFGAAGAWNRTTDAATAAAAAAATPVHTYAAADYVTWTVPATANATYNQGPNGRPSYRLEIKNLQLDGDFRGFAPGNGVARANWTPSGGLSTLWVSNSGTSPPTPKVTLLDESFLYWTGGTGSQTLTLDLKSNTAPGLWFSGAYLVRYDFVNMSSGSTMKVALNNPTPALIYRAGVWNEPSINSVTTHTRYARAGSMTLNSTNVAGGTTLVFGALGSPDAVALDNVRMVKTDLSPSVELVLPSLSSTSLKLLPGTKSGAYLFEFYVRDDPTAVTSAPSEPLVDNRFVPTGVAVSIIAAQKSGTTTLPPVFASRPASGWSSWTKVVVPLGIDFVDNDSDLAGRPALKIRLTPTDPNNPDVGSVLVAEPRLTYNP